jgi:hypothetical protein
MIGIMILHIWRVPHASKYATVEVGWLGIGVPCIWHIPHAFEMCNGSWSFGCCAVG